MTTVLVFSGYNMRAVLAFVRTLESHHLPYAVIASSADDPIFRTSYRSKVVAVRSSARLEIDTIMALLERVTAQLGAPGYLVAPSTEALNRFILRYRQDLRSLAIDIALTDEPQYLAISDKATFKDLCIQAQIDTPIDFQALDEAPLPFVAKPMTYESQISGKKLTPVVIVSKQDLTDFKNTCHEADFFYQEYVDGASYYILFYFFKNGGKPIIYSQENLIQQHSGGSILAAISSDIHDCDIAKRYEKLFLDLGFSGLIMVEVRGTKQAPKMIEANPRFWGPSQLFVDAGINLFEAMLTDNGFALSPRKKPAPTEPTNYFWDDGYSLNDANIRNTAFHNYSANQLRQSYEAWDAVNLFKRPDSMDLYNCFVQKSELARSSRLAELKTQYMATSKHSGYQILPSQLESLLSDIELDTHSRHEKERFEFIKKAINFRGKSVLDIGGNTGYFTFEALSTAAHVTYFEGNATHANFVATAAEILNLHNKLDIRNQYFRFDECLQERYDVVFLLNVLHHVGDDFGNTSISKSDALDSIVESLVNIAKITDTLVLQLGFNWKGDPGQPLFETGQKREMIEFLKSRLGDCYDFSQIGIADSIDGRIKYESLAARNIERRDDLGEFLNRPLIIMRSRAGPASLS